MRARDAHALAAYMSAAAGGAGMQQLLATRIVAGVTDADAYVLHDLAAKFTAAQISRCVLLSAVLVSMHFCRYCILPCISMTQSCTLSLLAF